MKILLCFIAATVSVLFVVAQYKNDNVLYKTVYTNNLCDSLQKYPDRLILDVRTKHEFNEDQMPGMSGMNLGHFKNAKNIDINNLKDNVTDLSEYKDKAVFVVCSHSQRSRRASNFLVKNGFRNVLNINGGMTAIHQLPEIGNECLFNQITTSIKYNLVSPAQFCNQIRSGVHVIVIDVRNDSSYKNHSLSAKENSYGSLKNSIHVPLGSLENNLKKIPTSENIILADLEGNDSEKAADILLSHNFTNVSILAGGIERLVSADSHTLPCRNDIYLSPVPFKIIGSTELADIYPTLSRPVFIDLRSSQEFNNNHKDSWRNIGRLDGAVNIPYGELNTMVNSIDQHKSDPVLIYGFSDNDEIYDAAMLLNKRGFKNIYVMAQGIFNLRWTANNIKGYNGLSKLVVNVPEENL